MKTPSDKARRCADAVMRWLKADAGLAHHLEMLITENAKITTIAQYDGSREPVGEPDLDWGRQEIRDQIAAIIDEERD